MAALQSLGFQTQDSIPKELLPYHTYFSSMVLCVYDNILGPTLLKVWLSAPLAGPELPQAQSPLYSSLSVSSNYEKIVQPEAPSMEQLLLISSYVIKDEACREDKINGIETKFYALEKFDLIASSFIFRAPLRGGKMALFAFYVTLPYKELAEFMPRYSLCEDKIRSILKKQIINKMEEKKYERPVKGLIGEQVEEFLFDFSHKLQGLSQVMLSVRYESIPLDIPVDDTILGFDNSKLKGWIDFLSEAITCHLQIGGHTVIFGEDKEIIMKMLNTLALFLSPKERKMSRVVPQSKSEGKRYIPNLLLQGYIKKPDGSFPFPLDYLWKSKFPSAVIDMDKNKIYTNESTVPVYLRRKNENNSPSANGYTKTLEYPTALLRPAASVWISRKSRSAYFSSFQSMFIQMCCYNNIIIDNILKYTERDFLEIHTLAAAEMGPLDTLCSDDLLPFEKGKVSHTVKDFIRQIMLLPMSDGSRDLFIDQFMRLLQLKAITACKYIEAEIETAVPATDSSSGTVWHVKGEDTMPKVNKDILMKELGLGESPMDLSVILCFAEKIRPNSYKDVLGDPQKDIEHILTDLEFV